MNTLIIDANFICHAVYHSLPAMSFNHENTEIIYGFIKRIMSYARIFSSDNIVFTWDSKTSIRKEVYPEYKKQRVRAAKEQTEQEKHLKRIAYLQFDEIRDCILPDLGFSNVLIEDGYEADDLMAAVVGSNSNHFFTIVTTDRDIYQLISNRCRLYNPATKITRTVESFEKEFDCHPSIWGEAKAIAGCSTDNVAGIKGVAEKTAILYLTDRLNKTSKKYNLIKQNEKLIDTNRLLVKLPLYGLGEIKINENNSLSRAKFVKVCERYGFRSLQSKNMLDRWDNLLEMRF